MDIQKQEVGVAASMQRVPFLCDLNYILTRKKNVESV